ncbi:MAG: alpha/beta fold hydrolase [Gammaproteobacteria bacterium]
MSAPQQILTPLTLIHGWGFNRRVFDPLHEFFARARIEMSFWELPGHGERIGIEIEPTLSAWARDCLSALPREPQVILGWSLGGLVALELALRFPERIRGLILVCTTPRFLSGPDWPDGHDLQVLERFEHDLEEQYEATLRNFLLLQICNLAASREVVPRLRDALASGGVARVSGLRAGLEILKVSDLRYALRGGLRQPVALLAGKRDRLVMPGAIDWMAHTLGIEPAWLVQAGHVPFLTDPDWFTRQVTGFLNAHANL